MSVSQERIAELVAAEEAAQNKAAMKIKLTKRLKKLQREAEANGFYVYGTVHRIGGSFSTYACLHDLT